MKIRPDERYTVSTLTQVEIDQIISVIQCWCGDQLMLLKSEQRPAIARILKKLAKMQKGAK